MSKWLLLALVLIVAFWWMARARRGDRQDRPPPPPSRSSEPPPTPTPQPMVACAHCGLRLPVAEAVVDEITGHPYCGPEHRRAGPAP